MVKITSRKELENWFINKPTDWAQVIAARAALRVLPIALNDKMVLQSSGFILSLFRATTISWAARNLPAQDMADAAAIFATRAVLSVVAAAAAAAANAVAAVTDFAADVADVAFAAAAAASVAFAADAANAAAAAAAADNVSNAADYTGATAYATANAAYYAATTNAAYAALIWQSINADVQWLEKHNKKSATQLLSHQPLWWDLEIPKPISKAWSEAHPRLIVLDKNYDIWIDWYERRLRGEEASFQIPHDKDRIEDKEILKKIADATDEDFWDKGAEYVNALLNEWLREARERAQERYEAENSVSDDIEIPAQEESVTTYMQREDGKIDHAPATEENRLHDIPDARQSYADLRKKAQRLLNEGQRLGSALQGALQDFMESMPEDFSQALAYNIWRDGTELREIYDLHKIAAKSSDYEPDKLDEGIATKLNGVLSLFNNLAFDDDGLRQRDERIPPQQAIQHAVHEAQIAQSITEAAASDRDISTEAVRAELGNLAKTDDTDKNTPYASQQLIEHNKAKRNFFAKLFTVAKKSAVNVKDGAEREVGKSAIKFIINNKEALKEYVATAYSNLSLAKLIDWIVKFFGAGSG